MIPISGSASVHLSGSLIPPQLALIPAQARTVGTQLLIQTAQRELQFQLPGQPVQSPVALQQQGNQWLLRPLLTHAPPQPATQLPTAVQQAATPGQTVLLPLRLVAGQASVTLPGGTVALPFPLPPGGDWWLRISDTRQWQLVRPGQAQPLTPATQQGPAPTTPVSAPQTQARPFEGSGDPSWQQLTRLLGQQFGQSQLSQLPLPSLAQLAHPALLASLMSQVGQFPLSTRLAPPLGPLATLWQRLAGYRGRGERSELGRAVDALSDAERQHALSRITPLIDDLTQFQQQSQSDPDHPLLYLMLPYGQEREQRQLQLALQHYQESEQDKEGSWLLSLKFELSNGELLLKARYRAEHLGIEAIASTSALSEAVSREFDALRQRFTEAGLQIGMMQCRQGEVPKRLGTANSTLTYGATYG
ncbi:hypothetical protein KUV89_09490 [Marinobacter hydrocarbonoclasticus]|nr:hypothetical protein [Marinobacter nauticus]